MKKIYLITIVVLFGLMSVNAQKDESKVKLMSLRADTVAFETLMGISSYGWDPANKGILINWRRDLPDRVNNDSGGGYDDRNGETRHDTQNDIRALQHYYWFKRLHDGDNFFDEAIARLEPTVTAKFQKMSSKKGWMYYVLLRLWEYSGNKPFWKNIIMQWGSNVYDQIDHDLGVYYETDMGNCDCGTSTIYLDKAYRVDHQVEAGAAMVDCGTRFNRPEWVDAGYRQVLTAYEQSFSEKYGLFGRIYLFGNSGYKKDASGTITNRYDYSAFQNKLWDGQCKLGEASEEIDALVRAAAITNRPEIREKFIEISIKMLNALQREGIHDKTYGGFYQMMYIADSGDGKKAGYVAADKKEMRQASLLGTYYLANQIIGNNWSEMQDEMLKLLTTENTKPKGQRGMYLPDTKEFSNLIVNGYRASTAGYPFQLNPDWSIYQNKTVDENWVSNESNSLILLGLFQYMTPIDDISEVDDTYGSIENLLIDEDFTTWTKQGGTTDHTFYKETKTYPKFSGTYLYTCSAVDPKASTTCDTKGRITINPAQKADPGWLVLPLLPSVGQIKIYRDFKSGAHMRLDRLRAGIAPTETNLKNPSVWEPIDTDDSEATSGCIEYVFGFTSEEPVQLRITVTGQNSNNLTRLFVEKYPEKPNAIYQPQIRKNPLHKLGNSIIAESSVKRMYIYTISGTRIKETSEAEMNISDLSQGVYIIRYILKTGETGVLKVTR